MNGRELIRALKARDINDHLMDGTLPEDPTTLAVPVNAPAKRAMGDRLSVLTDTSWIDELDGDHPSVPKQEEPCAAFPRIDAVGIFAPLPAVPYVVQAIDLCPGAPALIAGFGFSGKTAAAQQLAIEVASGQPAWGRFAAKAGRVLHIDYEQGSRLTRERYQRFARASLVGPGDLLGRLELSCLPPVYLDGKVAEDALSHELEGFDLAIFDSLRAAAPSIDENSSDIRRPLDLLHRVSEKTGCACLVIHHSRKPTKDSQGGAKMAIRGSGAIFDACSSVLSFDGEQKGGLIGVSHHKARTSGILVEDFSLQIADVELDGQRRAGLSVTATSGPKRAAPSGEKLDSIKKTILDYLKAHGPAASKNSLFERSGVGHRNAFFAAMAELQSAGQVSVQKNNSVHLGNGRA